MSQESLKKFSIKSKWLYLGSQQNIKNFKNLIGPNTNFKFRNIDKEYLVKNKYNAKGVIIEDDELLNKNNIQFLFELNNKGIKYMRVSNWCERYLNRYPSELIKVAELIEGKFSHNEFSFKARTKRIIECYIRIFKMER